DGSVADDAAGFAVELHATAARPAAAARGPVKFGNAAGDGEEQCERVLGDGARADSRGGGDVDFETVGGGEIDVVSAGAPDGKQAQLRTGLEDAGSEARGSADVQDDFGEA